MKKQNRIIAIASAAVIALVLGVGTCLATQPHWVEEFDAPDQIAVGCNAEFDIPILFGQLLIGPTPCTANQISLSVRYDPARLTLLSVTPGASYNPATMCWVGPAIETNCLCTCSPPTSPQCQAQPDACGRVHISSLTAFDTGTTLQLAKYRFKMTGCSANPTKIWVGSDVCDIIYDCGLTSGNCGPAVNVTHFDTGAMDYVLGICIEESTHTCPAGTASFCGDVLTIVDPGGGGGGEIDKPKQAPTWALIKGLYRAP